MKRQTTKVGNMPKQRIEQQANLLAKENRKADPDIQKAYWFPDDKEVRLVELHPDVPSSRGKVIPFYFNANPRERLYAPSGIALIRPGEFGKLTLPDSWGGWESAIEINIDPE